MDYTEKYSSYLKESHKILKNSNNEFIFPLPLNSPHLFKYQDDLKNIPMPTSDNTPQSIFSV